MVNYSLSMEKHKVLGNLIVVLFIIYLSDLFKLIYSNPRPYFLTETIWSRECDTGYGDPSGHAFIGSFFYVSLAIKLFWDNKKEDEEEF